MSRPRKGRRICAMPDYNRYGPLHNNHMNSEIIKMSLDEYEAIRLIDLEGLTQEECSQLMAVGRTTVQAIYSLARKKIADSIVNQKVILIEGGDIEFCEDDSWCHRRGCHRQTQRGQRGRLGQGRFRE